MSPQVFVSVVQGTHRGPWFRSCVVEREAPIEDAFHLAELKVLVAEKLGAETASLTVISWDRLEAPE